MCTLACLVRRLAALLSRQNVVAVCVITLGIAYYSSVAAEAAPNGDVIPRALQAVGHTPEWVQSQFGKPDHVQTSGICCNFSGYDSARTVSQSYELEDGGVLGFVYQRPLGSDRWIDVGVVYDALQSERRQSVQNIFVDGDLRQQQLFTCYDKDFYHYVEGMPLQDGWQYALTSFSGWLASHGRLVYIKYLVTKPTFKYNAISGENVLAAIGSRNLDRMPIIQFAYLQSPKRVMDLHLMPNDDDFSITTSYKKCF